MWKMTCEVYLCTPPVGYSGSASTVKETNWNRKKSLKILLWAPAIGHVPPWIAWGRVPSPILCQRNWFCNFLSWLTMKTVFERDCSSKIWSKSHRRVLAWRIQGEIPLSLVFLFLFREIVRVILLCQFVHLYARLFVPTDCELWFTIDLVSAKSIVNTLEMLTLRVNSFAALLLTQPGIPIPPREGRMQPCFFFELVCVFEQDSKPCFGHIAAVVQSLHGNCPQIS